MREVRSTGDPRTRQGRRTLASILAAARDLASLEGLEQLSMQRLASEVGMSKSGLYAHFGSKEERQLATVEHAVAVFEAKVLRRPSGDRGSGLGTLLGRWPAFFERGVFPGGCFIITSAGRVRKPPRANTRRAGRRRGPRDRRTGDDCPAPSRTAARMLAPFPVVRISGRIYRTRVRINLLTVRAPARSTITVQCRGKGCRRSSQRLKAGSKLSNRRLRRFEQSLSVGTVFEILVSKGRTIGKYTRFTVRCGKLPGRSDACLSLDHRRARSCPTS